MLNLAILFAFFTALFSSTLHANATSNYKIFAGNTCKNLAELVAKQLEIPLSKVQIDRFNDGEIKIKVEENIRNSEVFIIQSTCTSWTGSINDNLMELFLLIRTMKRASAVPINVIIPYFGYARQDRKTESRVPISSNEIDVSNIDLGGDRLGPCLFASRFWRRSNRESIQMVF